MGVSCDLEVDVNGEEVFIVDKEIISSYSGRISNLFRKPTGGVKNLKVVFHDFPGGAESFELMARFCYNKGKAEISPLNLFPLYCIANFMEMNNSVSGTFNLLEQTEKSLEEIRYWTWSEHLVALKQCQDLLPVANTSVILQRILDCMVGKLALVSETSPCPSISSSDSSGIRFSCDTRSTESLRSSSFHATWWFEDLVVLNPNLVQMVTETMVSRKFDHVILSRFLFYYQKSRFILATSDEKREITGTVVNILYSLDPSAISCKSLFGILRVSLCLSIGKCCRDKLESMIGSQMDRATLDNLLVPSPVGTHYQYNVNLVLRLLRSFLSKGILVPLVKLKKVASLMDLYISEVAPDPCLKPSKFSALISALPDSARDTYDGIYHAIDMYLEVHDWLSEEEKLNLCCGLNYEKLSLQACDQLAQNPKFPSKSAVQALISQHSKPKCLLHETNQPKPFIDSPCSSVDIDTNRKKDEAHQQIVPYAGNLDISSENEKLKAHLQGMQRRVVELEKVCKKMQTQMTKIMKSRLSSQSSASARSLPKLCS
ncbi:BTB/POZ domain-containing protein At3g22104-like isoform X2 [Rhododendron vialii]|uniref:BTB/POZ domain-containing protein At3g22104-like isoform X2 n=1 Tax=Rhododendron vialii TaxID=182163 RepID=UPI00265F24AC|nr:BTB/POZ domain-containing protein At3g22104-like isoform X2 [Rhododendron vialii]